MTRTVAAIFHSPMGSTRPERFVEEGRIASAADLIGILKSSVDEILVVTSDAASAERFHALDVSVSPPPAAETFHLGRSLRLLLEKHHIDALLYFGSGSGTLLNSELIDVLLAFAERRESGALFNNYYSCDFAVFSAARTLLSIDLPQNDNALGFALSDAGIPCFPLLRTLETDFDVDTPTDLLLLRAAGRGGPAVRRLLATAEFEHPTIDSVLERLTDPASFVHLSGRIHPSTWASFERQVACRTCGVIEGRGMRAYGDARALLLRRILREDGPGRFFERLAEVADVAVLDTRPLLATAGGTAPAADRFASDLFLHEEVQDPQWRAFTRAAREASIPVLLGGHSLVSGGLSLLAEGSWKGRELVRRLHPRPYLGRNDLT